MESSQNSLQATLDAKKADFLAHADADKITAYAEGIEAVIQAQIVEKAHKTGDLAPAFSLPNAQGETVNLNTYLAKGPVVLTWYRGGWCPYCNLTLRALQEALPEIQKQGAQLLALTPELPDNSLSTSEKNELTFEVLTDLNNEVARSYGLVFELTPTVHAYYKNAFSLETYNGNDKPELPLAATYIIGKDGVIQWHFTDAEYRNRAEPADIVRALTEI